MPDVMIRLAILPAILGAALLLAAGPAAAQGRFQVDPQSRFLHQLDHAHPRTVLLAFAECLVEEEPEDVLELLEWESLSEPAAELIADLVDSGSYSDCLTYSRQPARQMTMSERAFRGALSEVLYYRAHPSGISPALTSLEPADISQQDFVDRIAGAASSTEESLVLFGHCVVRHAPEPADNLLRTDIDSEAEAQAVEQLAPHFGGCLWEGQSIQLNIENLRAIIAQSTYLIANDIEQRRAPPSERFSDSRNSNGRPPESRS
ncbi:MAG: hypothetical protein ABR601_04050 [Parasphingopyxis sp.]